MSEYLIQSDTLTGIADAIREKVGSSDGIDPAQMAELIKGIEAGGGGGNFFVTEFVPSENLNNASAVAIEHSLGKRPDFCLVIYDSEASTEVVANSVLMGVMSVSPWKAGTERPSEQRAFAGCVYSRYAGGFSGVTAQGGTNVRNRQDDKDVYTNLVSPVKSATETSVELVPSVNNGNILFTAGVSHFVVLGVYE